MKTKTVVETMALDWTQPADLDTLLEKYPRVDVITASDIIFIPSIANALIGCIKGVMKANEGCVLLLSQAYRKPSDEEFVPMMEKEGFAVERVKHSLMDEMIQSDDIDVFIIRLNS